MCPPFTALRAVGTLIDRQAADRPRRPGLPSRAPGRLHRRGLPRDGAGRPVRDRRPLRAPPVRGRGRRAGQPQGPAVLGAGMQPIVCVGEVLEEREAGRTAEVVQGQVRGSLAGPPATRWPAWWWPTSRCGPSAPAAPPPPTTPRRTIAVIRATVADLVGQAPPASSHPVRRQRQGRQRRGAGRQARHRRRPGRRGQPRRRRVRPDRQGLGPRPLIHSPGLVSAFRTAR